MCDHEVEVDIIEVDIIVPVHNSAGTIEEAVNSAMKQEIPEELVRKFQDYCIKISVCCYDDGSKDSSWSILKRLEEEYRVQVPCIDAKLAIESTLLIKSSKDGVARGAGFARNHAIKMRTIEKENPNDLLFLCLLDSDDICHRHRVAEQLQYMLELEVKDRNNTLLGCMFERDPPESTWHYTHWANSLSDERIMLERFREVTILQPTWFMTRSRWSAIGGYIEAPPPGSQDCAATLLEKENGKYYRLIHPDHDNLESLRLAEDLRFFHAHLRSNGILRLHRTKAPLVMYRHTGTSQSFQTSRKLLLQLRALAFEQAILPKWQDDEGYFVVWSAGRDGKEFVKALSEESRKRVYCFVDVDAKKLETGSYVNRELNLQVPIIHFSFLASDADKRQKLQRDWEEGKSNDELVGRIDKSKKGEPHSKECASQPEKKKRKTAPKLRVPENLCLFKLQKLPVVVCVAMYRTNGVLEKNVQSIGRKEGISLWHFS